MVTGGSQTRIGSHRMYERLAKSLSDSDYPCLRYDRRGVGDSAGDDPGFRGSGPDLAAAAAAFRAQSPGLERVIGFGLCDGASAIALFGDEAKLDGLILVNPWLVEAEAGAPPPAAIRRHYRQRLLSREGWKKILSGAVNYRKLLNGIRSIVAPRDEASLARDVAETLLRHRIPAEAILCEGDATAIAAAEQMNHGRYSGLILAAQTLDTDSHTFARPGDEAMLLTAVLTALEELES
jgi:exosortase A-associated hydrolase 1